MKLLLLSAAMPDDADDAHMLAALHAIAHKAGLLTLDKEARDVAKDRLLNYQEGQTVLPVFPVNKS